MTITLEWKDKRYAKSRKYTYECMKDEEWKLKKITFVTILKQKSEREAKEFMKSQFTNCKNRSRLLAIQTEEDNSYWSIYF